jgi:GNAT superfamily N-acetyltransferase
MILVREAVMGDVGAIRDIFLACYGSHYPYADYYDEHALHKLVFSDDTLLLVAEDTDTRQILGTASVILEVGALSDLVGEFGRLAVHPDARNRGVGHLLMAERLARVRDRLQAGVVDARVSHPYTLKIAEAHGFHAVGFLPQKMLLAERESLTFMVRHFGAALELRRNHPRVIPEVAELAEIALGRCGLTPDAVIDEEAPAYPPGGRYDIEAMPSDGYAALLRIERGRVRRREIFGPVRLHYGFFKLQARHCTYLIARADGRIAGAVGFAHDPVEHTVSVFELIALHDDVVRVLLAELVRRCEDQWQVAYMEVSVSAIAPRMQRTLLELSFAPVAYAPALAFVDVERLDVVKFARLFVPLCEHTGHLTGDAAAVAEIVLRQFRLRAVLPCIARAVRELSVFAGLDDDQVRRLASACSVRRFDAGATIFRADEPSTEMLLLLDGEAAIARPADAAPVGVVGRGESLGEVSLLTGATHSATATARTRVEAAALSHRDLADLIRRRPDIGLLLYRNLSTGLAAKLKRADVPWKDRSP